MMEHRFAAHFNTFCSSLRWFCRRAPNGSSTRSTLFPSYSSTLNGHTEMTGYEKSPDYGGGGIPPWTMWLAVAIVVALVAAFAWIMHP